MRMKFATPGRPFSDPRACDDMLVKDVREAMAATGHVRLQGITVIVHEGFVALRGRVPSYRYKQLAQEVAKSVPGVESLRNEVVVD